MDVTREHGPNASIVPRGYAARTSHLTRKLRASRDQEEVTLREVWQTLMKRKMTFIACFAVATLAALIISLILPTRYEAVGRLTVDFDSTGGSELDVLARATGVD